MWPFSRKSRTSSPVALNGRAVQLRVRARYDAATTSDDNRKHWAMADAYSADAANTPLVRRTLRNRARYEVANNSFARGMVLTLANDTVGTGPRLQMLVGDGENAGINEVVEREFARWAKAVSLAEKLRTMRMAKVQDGETFALLTTNPKLASPIKLDFRLIEAEQVASPFPVGFIPTPVDGILFDEYRNPRAYQVLKNHPGGINPTGYEYDVIPARSVIHLFRVDRPGQHRGIPELMPALPLFSQLRRYTLAVLDAAEMAADFAGILYTDAPANGEAAAVEPMDTIELERRMLTTMPDGWKLGQIDAKQPATTYPEFKCELLKEIARCLNMPYNVAAGDSSGYNYASGRLDHQVYFKSIRVEQSQFESIVLDRLLAAWLAEAAIQLADLAPLRADLASDLPPHTWFWDGNDHVDPLKEATAQGQRLANCTTTLADEYGRRGLDWEVQLRQRAKEVELMKELELPIAAAGTAQPAPADEPTDEQPPKPGQKNPRKRVTDDQA